MDIYELMREIGEDTPEMDLVTDDMLDGAGLDPEDFEFQGEGSVSSLSLQMMIVTIEGPPELSYRGVIVGVRRDVWRVMAC